MCYFSSLRVSSLEVVQEFVFFFSFLSCFFFFFQRCSRLFVDQRDSRRESEGFMCGNCSWKEKCSWEFFIYLIFFLCLERDRREFCGERNKARVGERREGKR